MKKIAFFFFAVLLILIFSAPVYSVIFGFKTMVISHEPGLGYAIQTVAYPLADDTSRLDTPAPQPATLLLLGTALVGLAGVSRKRSSNTP